MSDRYIMGVSVRKFFIFAILPFTFVHAAVAQDTNTKAISYAVGMDTSSQYMVSYCQENNSINKTALYNSWQVWRNQNKIDTLKANLSENLQNNLNDKFSSMKSSIYGKMQKEGDVNATCKSIENIWNSDEFNLKVSFPDIYTALNNQPKANPQQQSNKNSGNRDNNLSTSGNTFDLKGFNPDYVLQDLSPSGTYYTPAQLTALFQSWRNAGDRNASMNAMRNHGAIFIKGKVVKGKEYYYLKTDDGSFHSKLSVSTGLNISMFEGQTITVVGSLDELPNSMVFLRKAKLVQDTSNLKRSNLDDKAGLYRNAVDKTQIMASEGNGLKPEDIHGILYHGYGATGVNGYEFREDVRLLLKDGSVYFRNNISPDKIDVVKSKKLEPNLWGRWRKNGNQYQIAQNDEFGVLGIWSNFEGHILPQWDKDQRISGRYTHSAFYGSIALGGTYSNTTIIFNTDGTFERVGYSQSGSGTMAQTGSGFSSSASSYSDGKGSSSVAGGGNDGTFTGGSNYASTSKKSNDGSGNRGRYYLSGTNLQMRYDNGRVENVLCAPWDTKHDNVYMFGVTYSRK